MLVKISWGYLVVRSLGFDGGWIGVGSCVGLGLGIGVDVFNEIDSSDTNSQALTIQNQALSRSDFIPELEHWFRRTIWFLGFSAVWTLSPSLAIITVIYHQF